MNMPCLSESGPAALYSPEEASMIMKLKPAISCHINAPRDVMIARAGAGATWHMLHTFEMSKGSPLSFGIFEPRMHFPAIAQATLCTYR